MQDTQTLKAKIIALLDLLPADNLQLLAEFATFLRAKSEQSVWNDPQIVPEAAPETKIETSLNRRQSPIRIASPHLVNRAQIADFTLEVIEETPHDPV